LKVILKSFLFFAPFLLIIACGDSSTSDTSTGYESPNPPPVSSKLSQPAPATASNTAKGLSAATGTGTQVTIVNGDPGGKTGEYIFAPDVLNFKKGESVDFTLTAESEVHNFNIEPLNIDTDIDAGETLSFNYVFDTVGTFKFICIFHEANGMVGTITVTE
tara:strand:+ start:117 stop:599 length:483 start_codon:yes stop_codon:yes gene_type:complete